jgi:hypothetical protein
LVEDGRASRIKHMREENSVPGTVDLAQRLGS